MSCDIQRKGCTLRTGYLISVVPREQENDYHVWDACPACAAWLVERVKEAQS